MKTNKIEELNGLCDSAEAACAELRKQLEVARQERDESCRALNQMEACLSEHFKGVVAIRCMKHFRVPPYNRNERMGGECPVCKVEEVEKERDQAQAACAVKDEALRESNDCLSRFSDITSETRAAWAMQRNEKALALDCGTGWKSAAEYAALEAKLAEMVRSHQMCVGAAGIGDFSELCGWIDATKAKLAKAEAAADADHKRAWEKNGRLLDERDRLRKALEFAKPTLKSCFVGRPPNPLSAQQVYEFVCEALAPAPEDGN